MLAWAMTEMPKPDRWRFHGLWRLTDNTPAIQAHNASQDLFGLSKHNSSALPEFNHTHASLLIAMVRLE